MGTGRPRFQTRGYDSWVELFPPSLLSLRRPVKQEFPNPSQGLFGPWCIRRGAEAAQPHKRQIRERSRQPDGACSVSLLTRRVAGTWSVLALLLLAAPSANAHQGFSLRINCGGTAYVDTSGNTWADDIYFSGTSNSHMTGQPIAATEEDPLFQVSRVGKPFSYDIPLNNAIYSVTLHFAENQAINPGTRVFDVEIEGVEMVTDLDLIVEHGGLTATSRSFEIDLEDGNLDIDFFGDIGTALISAIEIIDVENGHPFLHVVQSTPELMIDYDGDGKVTVDLKGAESHTHEVGHNLVQHTWTTLVPGFATVGGGGSMVEEVLGVGENITTELGLGVHPVSLTIEDDNVPPETLSGTVAVPVYPAARVKGVFTSYLSRSPAGAGRKQQMEYVEVRDTLRVEANGNQIGGSHLTQNVRVLMESELDVPNSATYEFQVTGGRSSLVWVNDTRIQGSTFLDAGTHDLKVVAAVDSIAHLPLEVEVNIDGGGFGPVIDTRLHHDQRDLKPFINSASQSGSELGGETITLTGWGFFPPESVMVRWGNQTLMEPDLTITQNEIKFLSLSGTGSLNIRVETPNGTSNRRPYSFVPNQAPIVFNTSTFDTFNNPTRAAWGPDGRLYVASLDGNLEIHTVDDNYGITATQTVTTISALSNPEILGIAFNPLDPPSPVKLYLSHCELYAHNGGDCPLAAAPYNGQISMLEGPNFDTVNPVITNLPISNHDHGINELVFDHHGELYFTSAGNTNAGIVKCSIGGLPESPLAAGLIRAPIGDSNFNGTIDYFETGTDPAVINNDQRFGDIVSVMPDVTVYPCAMGLRNAYGMVLTVDNHMFATDNGPDSGFGVASTSATTQGSSAPQDDDEIVRLVEGGYYGHPNRAYGRDFDHANVYQSTSDPSIEGEHIGPLLVESSSINGIFQYRASTFGNAMWNNLIFQKWNDDMYRAELAADSLSIDLAEVITTGIDGLAAIQGPGGVIIGVDYTGDQVQLAEPDDAAVSGLTLYDIFPWRARADGTVPFVIGGENFGTLADTVVTIGGQTAALTSVSSNRIRGFIPALATPSADLLDVMVEDTSSETVRVLPDSFRYVFDAGTGVGTWETEADLPTDLGEVAAGAVAGVLYLVGSGSSSTLSYDLSTRTWSTTRAARPHVGDHHSLEVIGHKIYLFGGLGGGSAGKVQIYDPLADSWSLGTDIPLATGSASTAVIDGKVYVAGGIVSNSTVSDAWVYDPELDSWSTIASMPVGRNHAAAGTDGEKFYIFGGRGPGSGNGNSVAIGFDDVLVYDPVMDTWEASFDIGSTIPDLPQKRGGMGKAVFFRGEFYVMGGETTSSGTGQVAGNVYDRVDVYDPVAESWRLDTAMVTPRHGIYPVYCDRAIYVVGGGVVAGSSNSGAVERFGN